MAEFISKSVRSVSEILSSRRRKRISGPSDRLLLTGPEDILQTFHQMWKLCFKDVFGSCEKMSTEAIKRGPLSNLTKLPIAFNDVFILMFDLADEESFQKISAYRETIIKMKGSDVPLLIVGCNQMSSARIMGPETADCLVTIEWGLSYTEASYEDLDFVFAELVKIIVRKRCNSIEPLERRMTTGVHR